MRVIEPYSPALQDVTKATQRSVLAVMGSRRRPVFALLVSILLGAVAGWGEEWLFRGVFQTSMSRLFGEGIALGVSGVTALTKKEQDEIMAGGVSVAPILSSETTNQNDDE
eukprot:scaffold6580_cov195-Alexandrium_tamarense.AAC.3